MPMEKRTGHMAGLASAGAKTEQFGSQKPAAFKSFQALGSLTSVAHPFFHFFLYPLPAIGYELYVNSIFNLDKP